MVWYMSILTYIWELIKTWGSLFAAPISEPVMLWVLVPVYLTWIFTEAFQEKKGTSMGNATSNAVVVLWAAIDWSRTSINLFTDKIISTWNLVAKIFISLIVLGYGGLIIYEGLKGQNIIYYIGRIRVVSYIVIMLTPIVYGTIPITFKSVLAMTLFFPIFYYIIEFIDHHTPDPTPIKKDNNSGGNNSYSQPDNLSNSSDLGTSDLNSSNDLGDDLGDFKI